MTKRLKLVTIFAAILVLGFSFYNKKDPDPQKINATSIPTSMEMLKYQAPSNHDRTPSFINDVPLWTESFDAATFPPTGWLNLQESGTGLWTRVTTSTYPSGFTPHSGAGMTCFGSFSYSSGVAASLVSMSFSLVGGQSKVGFWMIRDAGYATNTDKVDFMINTTPSSSGATLLGTINRSITLAPVEAGADGWYYYQFTIPASFNTATNYLVLKATSAYGNDCYVDDVSIIPLLAHDAATQSIDMVTPHMPGTISPKATFKNNGTNVETFPVTMTITPGSYTSTKNVTSLAVGSTNQVTFDDWAATNGSYSVKVIAQLGTDLDRTNDTLVFPITITSAVWSTGSAMTSGSYLGSGVAYCNTMGDTSYLFAIGGNAPNLTSIYKYNVIANTWSAGAPMPGGRVVLGSAVAGRYVYAIAGSDGTNYFNTLYKYDIFANTWTTGTPLPTATLGWCKCSGYQDSLIYVVGGADAAGTTQTSVYLYNTISATWRTCTPLTTGCFGGGFAIAANFLVYSGGIQGTVPGSATFKGAISQTDRSQITWTTGAAYPGGTMWKTDMAPWGPAQVIMTTGTSSASSATWWTPDNPNPCYAYNPTNNTWTARPNLTTPVLGAYVGSVWNVTANTISLIVASGYNGTAAVTNTQIYSENLLGVNIISTGVPSKYSLAQNYPNPFNPSTKINFAIKSNGNVTMKIYNILGKEVATVVNEYKTAGTYSVDFNATNLASGIYFYKIQSGSFTDTKKMVLVK